MSKSLLIIGFIFSVVAAIPTYGLSLLAFFAIKYRVDQAAVIKIRDAAFSSKKADADGFPLPYASFSAIRTFFRMYGTTERGYKQFKEPSIFYAGYVKVLNSGEFLVVIFRTESGLIVSTFNPHLDFGNDALSLLQKKNFFDEVIGGLQRAPQNSLPVR